MLETKPSLIAASLMLVYISCILENIQTSFGRQIQYVHNRLLHSADYLSILISWLLSNECLDFNN